MELSVLKSNNLGKPIIGHPFLPNRNQAELWELSNLFQAPLSSASSLSSPSQLLPVQKQTQVWEAERGLSA